MQLIIFYLIFLTVYKVHSSLKIIKILHSYIKLYVKYLHTYLVLNFKISYLIIFVFVAYLDFYYIDLLNFIMLLFFYIFHLHFCLFLFFCELLKVAHTFLYFSCDDMGNDKALQMGIYFCYKKVLTHAFSLGSSQDQSAGIAKHLPFLYYFV